jgi:hypothetical protein
MSPEFQRNLWLEFTPSRVALMTSVLGLIAIAVYLISNRHFGALIPVGVGGYVLITLFWGTRNAARSVIGEIRERTWDFQRISAVTPASMTFGKLFGATIYTWYGGLLSLAIATPGLLRMNEPSRVVQILGLLVAAGLLAHAVALGSALATARRRRADARLSVLPHQVAGLIAAAGPAWAISSIDEPLSRAARAVVGGGALDQVTWFGGVYGMLAFTAVATLGFALWAMLGCWREMRLELMESNTPVFWPLFLIFLALFLAGLGGQQGAERLALAYVGVHVAAMIALLVEPKNAVDLRAFGGAVANARWREALTRMPAYGWAFLGAVVLGVALVAAAPVRAMGGATITASTALAALGFLARDFGVFHFYHAKPRQMRGDFAGLVTLALLYVVGGGIANVIDNPVVLALTAPHGGAPAWAAILPWLQAGFVWFLAARRFRGGRAMGAGVPAEA